MRKERQGKGNKEKETYQRVPRPSAQADSIIADAQAAYAVLVAAQRAHLVSSEYIPHLQAVLIGGFVRVGTLDDLPCTQSHHNPQTAICQKQRKQPT